MRTLIIALALAATLLPLDAYTLGLGDIEVKSALNQDLDAEIKLLSTAPEDAESLIVKLASREEFSRAGLDRPFLLQSLKFGHVLKNDVPYLTITTSKPIREPFLNFLIEVDWPKGHLLREYTILLDPPVYINEQSAARPAASGSRPATETAPVNSNTSSSRPPAPPGIAMSTSSNTPSSTAPATTRAASTTTPMAAPSNSAPQQPGQYRIKQGDTAWSLANSLRPDQSVSIEQMMLALLRTNPESFIDGNVNGLKRGYILRVPERDQIARVAQNDAVAMVRQQNALWREYQQVTGSGKPASATPNTKPGKTATADSASSAARLSIVSAGKGAGTGSAENLDSMSADALRAQLALVEERLESERLEKESLQSEVSTLEQQVSKMKRLLSIEDQTLAGMSDNATTDPDATTGSAETQTPSEAEAEIAPESEINATAEQQTMPAEEAQPGASAEQNVFVDEHNAVNQPQQMPATEAMAETPAEPQPGIDDSMREQPNQPQGLVAKILNSPLVLAVAGGALLLVMALVYLIVKRRRTSQSGATDAAGSGFTDEELASVADMLDDNAVNQDVGDDDAEASMAEAEAEEFDSDTTMILPSSEDTVVTQAAEPEEEARDDIVAEADVYLAYGIYQQAEELLQGAIKENPENDAYRMKLAETYFAGKNTSGFTELAGEMHTRTKGTGTRWQKLVVMGKELIPDHELFKGESAVADMALDDLVPSAEPTMDIDLGDEDASADLDFSFDDDNVLDLSDTSSDDTALLDLETDSEVSSENELEFDLSETDAAVPATEDDDEFSLDIEASELDITSDATAPEDSGTGDSDLDFDLDLSAEAEAETEGSDNVSDDASEDEDDDMEFDIDVSAELDGDDLEATAGAVSVVGDDDDAEIDLSDISDVDEISTKLDLARAYLDMGDHEGTRSILEEVVAEGNAEQKAEAEAILADIDS